MNQVTHWLDLSQVYGSTAYVASKLRSHGGGLMRVDEHPMYSAGMLPTCGKEGVGDKMLPICSS